MAKSISIKQLILLCGIFVLVVTLGIAVFTGRVFLAELDDLTANIEIQENAKYVSSLASRTLLVGEFMSVSQKSEHIEALSNSTIVAIYDRDKNIVWNKQPNFTITKSEISLMTTQIDSVRVGDVYKVSIPVLIDADMSSLREYEAETFSDSQGILESHDDPIGYILLEIPYTPSIASAVRNRYLIVIVAIVASMILLLSLIIYRMVGKPLTQLKRWIANNESDIIRNEIKAGNIKAEEISSLVSVYLDQHQRITLSNENLEEQVVKRTEELGALTEKLRILAFRATHENENITKRIAAELHDDLCSIQISLKRKMESILKKIQTNNASYATSTDLSQNIIDWIDMTNKADDVARNIIGRFRTVVTEYLGLEAGLRDALMHNAESNESLDSFFINRSARLEELDPIMHSELVNIVQEAVRNVISHTNATRLTVSVDDRGSDVIIRISDNGGGFDRRTLTNSFGLQIMEERATYIQANVEFVRTEKGTEVVVTIPFKSLAE